MAGSGFKNIAIKAAKKAGKVHKKHLGRKSKVKEKSASFDLVTTADLEAEKAIVKIIKRAYSEHNILAEEENYEKTSSSYCWIIDPLDGTNNFSFGIPFFCVSIALAKDNQVILGVVYDVMRKELFWAEKGKGAYLNGRRIKVSDEPSLAKAMLITGFYYDRGKDMINNLEAIRIFFQKKIFGLRRLGAAALDLSYISCGRATGFWEFKLSPWDFAAGKLLVEEAGGKFTDKSGKDVKLEPSYIIASNGKIHAQLIETVNSF